MGQGGVQRRMCLPGGSPALAQAGGIDTKALPALRAGEQRARGGVHSGGAGGGKGALSRALGAASLQQVCSKVGLQHNAVLPLPSRLYCRLGAAAPASLAGGTAPGGAAHLHAGQVHGIAGLAGAQVHPARRSHVHLSIEGVPRVGDAGGARSHAARGRCEARQGRPGGGEGQRTQLSAA